MKTADHAPDTAQGAFSETSTRRIDQLLAHYGLSHQNPVNPASKAPLNKISD